MSDRPLCKCHDEPMRKAGVQNGAQSWRCSVKRKAYDKARDATPERKAYEKARNATPERKAYQKARDATPERKAYNASPERQARAHLWNNSFAGAIAQAKYQLGKAIANQETIL